MTNHSIILHNGNFIIPNHNQSELISTTQLSIGDWNCIINDKGVICTCESPYGLNRKATLKYTILKNGLSRLVLKIPGSNPIVKKKKWLTKPGQFTFDGTLILTDGEICKRGAGFKVIKNG